ncbi:hypothetical protein ACWGB8_17615 [Kitasatospora sp. NPDC054939]
MTTDETAAVVGVRPASEVFAALEELSIRRRPWTDYEQGMLHAYRWAVGTRDLAPATAAQAVGAVGPCRAQLLAECQAAEVQIRMGTGRSVADTDWLLGAFAALAWLCGHHDDRP